MRRTVTLAALVFGLMLALPAQAQQLPYIPLVSEVYGIGIQIVGKTITVPNQLVRSVAGTDMGNQLARTGITYGASIAAGPAAPVAGKGVCTYFVLGDKILDAQEAGEPLWDPLTSILNVVYSVGDCTIGLTSVVSSSNSLEAGCNFALAGAATASGFTPLVPSAVGYVPQQVCDRLKSPPPRAPVAQARQPQRLAQGSPPPRPVKQKLAARAKDAPASSAPNPVWPEQRKPLPWPNTTMVTGLH